jgi:hypothetical protein
MSLKPTLAESWEGISGELRDAFKSYTGLLAATKGDGVIPNW